MDYIFLSHSSVGGHLGGLISRLLWTVQRRCASIFAAFWPVVLQIHPQERGTAGTCGTFYFCFFFFENLHTDFHNDYTNLHFHQQRTRVPLCLYLICLHSNNFSMRATLTGEREFQSRFNVYSSDGWGWGTVFTCLCHSYLYSWELSVQFITQFLDWMTFFCCLKFATLCLLWVQTLAVM